MSNKAWLKNAIIFSIVSGISSTSYGCGDLDFACKSGVNIPLPQLPKAPELPKLPPITIPDPRKTIEDLGQASEKAVQDIGKTVEKAVNDAGKNIEKGAQDAGKALEKGVQDSGMALEKAAQDTGKTLEKAGQDIGKFLEQATNFSLSCKLPGSKPDDLQKDYKQSCQSNYDKYKNDVDVCNKAGGVSLIAAVAASGPLTWTQSAGATYVLAKIAFEMCENACRSQSSIYQCMSDVDKGYQGKIKEVDDLAKKNDAETLKQEKIDCLRRAYSIERLLIMDTVLLSCKAKDSCNSDSEEYKKSFELATRAVLKDIDDRRESAEKLIMSGANAELEYGEYIAEPSVISSLAVYQDGSQDEITCYISNPKFIVNVKAVNAGPLKVKFLVYRHGITQPKVIDAEFDTESKSKSIPIDIAGLGLGKWRIDVVGTDLKKLASYGVIYRIDPQSGGVSQQ